MTRHLVVGGRSVAGQAALRVLRQQGTLDWLGATTTTTLKVTGASETFRLQPGELVGRFPRHSIDVLVFTLAGGDAGYPVEAASVAAVDKALAAGVQPLQELLTALQPRLAVAFSTFHWLPHCQAVYGAVAHAKHVLEAIAADSAGRLKVVRAGVFPSHSSKALALLIYRHLKLGSAPMLHEAWKLSGLPLIEFVYRYAAEHEAAAHGEKFAAPYRPTAPSDLERAIALALQPHAAPFVNVIGDWLWRDDELHPYLG